jgi:CheY-like chemotaxis protein
MKEKHGLEVNVDTTPIGTPLVQHIRAFLFESVREFLFNIVKHSGVDSARVLCKRNGDELLVRVEDEGSGFDVSRLEVAGEAGAGFGLFSIRERASYLGGRLVVESTPGAGSRFSLYMPMAVATAAVQPAAEKAAEPVKRIVSSDRTARDGEKIRVILVDDHPVLRHGLARVLQDQPDIAVVGEAGDGKAGVELARDLLPDVVVMDVSMPVMNGITATEELRKTHPGIAVVGLSMHEDPAMESAIRAAGAVAFVTKGGPSNALILAIQSAVGQARAVGGGGDAAEREMKG